MAIMEPNYPLALREEGLLALAEDTHKHILDRVHTRKQHRRQRQGPQGRQQRQGRLSLTAHPRTPCQGGMRTKEQATCIVEPHWLMVRQPDDRSEQDQENRILAQSATSMPRAG
jgi:hypothetical protein